MSSIDQRDFTTGSRCFGEIMSCRHHPICLDTTDSLTQTEAYEERVARLEEARHWPMAGMVCVSPMH